jgi:dATP pyrophosphohydrolase
MPRMKSNLVSVYLLREDSSLGSRGACPDRPTPGPSLDVLLLQRPPEHAFPDDWQVVHGHLEPGETAWQAALRELDEETSICPVGWYHLARVSSFYEPANDTIYLVPAFVALALAGAAFRLSQEHQAGAWCPLPDARVRLRGVPQRDAIDEIMAATTCWPQTGPDLTPMDLDVLRRTGVQRTSPDSRPAGTN